jgi:HPt (histidine-containing phosphotransfer) domain-containing protein
MTGVAVDLEALHELQVLLDEDFEVLLETFVRDSETRLKLIAEGVAKGDAALVREQAHSFKGSSANLYAPQLSALCEALERMAREGRLEGAPQLVADIESQYLAVLASFRERGWL